ncbi:MAG: phosphoglycerate dehydrogenase [Candidatus Nitricoxidivorans perseverans]|uniref:Phosphoglycerate dehydrogenase n=1 Tax=Candidatus Nitricoxidivorans perseverans TaxID=2975601 RepID=A0AA49FN11_9PROT|nr:MAG: phosphoglycerate dehydrogenase [Candidatus Nitricoxidivorans perseverans]
MADQFQVLILNNVSQNGLKRLPAERFACAKEAAKPDAILLRSADLHSVEIPKSVLAIGRAGSGTNNIPVKAMSARGVPVFNAPGANANAVKELVLAGMLLAARNIGGAMKFVSNLDPADAEMEKKVEGGKKTYAGYEIAGHTLGVVGLGKIGCLVADAAIKLGMNVVGYDPEITVDAAWSLPSQVKKANSLAEVLKNCNFVTVHVPLVEATRRMINATSIEGMKTGAVLLNFARDGVVDEAAVLAALEAKKIATYVCDFPSAHVNNHPHVIALPHLGASTREAEENCAIMVADQVRDYLLDGNIVNSVNFPGVVMPRESGYRIAVANANVPNMVGQISTAMADAKLNIHNMMNKSKGDVAYTLVDVDSKVPKKAIDAIAKIEGVLAVRYLPLEG